MTHIYLELLAGFNLLFIQNISCKAPWPFAMVIKNVPSCVNQFTSKFIPTSVRNNFKQSNHSRSHVGLENKSGQIFLHLASLFYKILPTNLGACKPTFYTFYTSHLRWKSTMRHRPQMKCSISQFLKTNCIHSMFRTIEACVWAFSKTGQKIFIITHTASRFSLLTSTKFAVNIKRVPLQHNKEFWC